jgi:hypothetical protein
MENPSSRFMLFGALRNVLLRLWVDPCSSIFQPGCWCYRTWPDSWGNCCVPPGPTSPLVHADLAVIYLSPDPMERAVSPGHLFVRNASGFSGHKVQKSHKSVPECRIAPPLSLQKLRTLYLSIEPCKVPTWTISLQISRSVTTDTVRKIPSSREDNELHPAEIFRNTEAERERSSWRDNGHRATRK